MATPVSAIGSKTPLVPSLERGMAILEAVAKSRSGLTLSQVSRSLGLAKSSTQALLLTLERSGYLCRSPETKRYLCEMKLVRIASLALDGIVLRDKARPILRQLMAQTNLTVHLAVTNAYDATLIEKLEPTQATRISTWMGKRLDYHCTSIGKSVLAYMPEDKVERIVRERGLMRHNENTIGSVARLRAELAKVRALGYAVDDEEEEIGIRCIGAPVLDADQNVIGAISVTGQAHQVDVSSTSKLCLQVRDAARALSQQIGAIPRL